MNALDLSVSFPTPGVIRLQSRSLFGDAENPTCRRFLERVFLADEIQNVTIQGGGSPQADLRYCPKASTLHDVVKRVVGFLSDDAEHEAVYSNGEVRNNCQQHDNLPAHVSSNGHCSGNGRPTPPTGAG